jgi:hypothetical protein
MNFIIEEMITRPKEIKEIYNRLPENVHKSIEKRDHKNNLNPQDPQSAESKQKKEI